MWIVRLALGRPYTFVVTALLVLLLGGVVLLRMPTDIFPEIDIPVISVVFNYPGMTPEDMERRIVNNFERFLVTVVNDVDHIESQALNGVSVVRIVFQRGAKIEAATAQVTAVGQSAIRVMPPGTVPPLIIRYSATSVPVLQLSLSSDTLSEQEVYDLAINSIRPRLITIPGVQSPYPYGGKQRQIMVDLDPEKLQAWGISPEQVSEAINAQNLILPAGTVKIGAQEYPVRLNSSPDAVDALGDLPVRTLRGATVRIRDLAQVRDGFSVQTNIVHADGQRGILMSILKSGGASTLEVVRQVKEALPGILAGLSPELKVKMLFDQSLFVRAAVDGVVKEAVFAAALTGLMILLFLGSWRSTVVVMTSIPLCILISIICLAFLGETLNLMTLGGLALVVGLLVDDATVEIENIHRNLHQGKRLVRAILDGAQQIAVPAFVSTTCICIVFVPVLFISGAAQHLFTPLALAVVFAMMSSYLLSRTLVPTLVRYLLAPEVVRYGGAPEPLGPQSVTFSWRRRAVPVALVLAGTAGGGAAAYGWGLDGGVGGFLRDHAGAALAWARADIARTLGLAFTLAGGIILLALARKWRLHERYHTAFDRQFDRLRRTYGGLLAWSLEHPWVVAIAFCGLVLSSAALLPLVGRDFFPTVDAGLIRMHVRAPPGTRIEETERHLARVEEIVRAEIPPGELGSVLDNIGIPYSGINLALSDGTLMSPADAEVLIALQNTSASTQDRMDALQRRLREEVPEVITFFQPPDMVTQVLNFGLSAAIDVQLTGPRKNTQANLELARRLLRELSLIPGARDLRLQQVVTTPDLRVEVDRELAGQVGLSQRDVARDLLVSLSSSGQVAPNYWLDPRSGVSYLIMVQTPQHRIDSLAALAATPVPTSIHAPDGSARVELLANLATVGRGYSATNITHRDLQPTFDVQLGVRGTDLASVAREVEKVLDRHRPELPPGSSVALRGQVESMKGAFESLFYGLVFAVLLVYLLMVINFQSWLDPLVILMALPGTISGIVWALFATGTTLSVPALMGAIMSIGVGTANSVLVITFANDQRKEGHDALTAALSAGMTRLRPVLMTASAMLIGMVPMALGLGEGGEQNAPLGRAVIGGLLLATLATLFLVPVAYSRLRRAPPQTRLEPELIS